jgi:hypothetical protein
MRRVHQSVGQLPWNHHLALLYNLQTEDECRWQVGTLARCNHGGQGIPHFRVLCSRPLLQT